ncbi:uncharacterized protein LOC133931287 isoform X3 [Phragmites australis]|uniref:uncharacterized protein LOC133931287 isoform X3 n=1 Tax=Phragmites australis TaxID=29695 RepID=UPI002D793FBF|nr:uncharacterized protein LOC133931287 isoform X3 [Phragmites australis]
MGLRRGRKGVPAPAVAAAAAEGSVQVSYPLFGGFLYAGVSIGFPRKAITLLEANILNLLEDIFKTDLYTGWLEAQTILQDLFYAPAGGARHGNSRNDENDSDTPQIIGNGRMENFLPEIIQKL